MADLNNYLQLIANLIIIISFVIGVIGGFIYYFKHNYLSSFELEILKKAKSINRNIRIVTTDKCPKGTVKIGGNFIISEEPNQSWNYIQAIYSLHTKRFIELCSPRYLQDSTLFRKANHWVLTKKGESQLFFQDFDRGRFLK